MSIEIDKARKSERRKQLLLLPVAIAVTCVSVALYVFHFKKDIQVSGINLWGPSKYIWLNTTIFFVGVGICGIFSLLSLLVFWARLIKMPRFRVRKKVLLIRLAKFFIIATTSLVICSYLVQVILENVQLINRELSTDSVVVELLSFLAWYFATVFILAGLGNYLFFSIRAPFEAVKNNEIHIDFSANDGSRT